MKLNIFVESLVSPDWQDNGQAKVCVYRDKFLGFAVQYNISMGRENKERVLEKIQAKQNK